MDSINDYAAGTPKGALSSSAASDALELLGFDSRVVDGLALVCSGQSGAVVGRVRTVRAVETDEAGLPGLADVLDSLDRGDVLVIAWESSHTASTLGGLAARRMVSKGASAVISAGWVRDKVELEATGLTIWARGTTPRTGRGRLKICIERSVQLSGVTVHDGDIAVVDATGICFVPAADFQDVLRAAAVRLSLDDDFEREMLAGSSFAAAQESTGAI